jgi:tripartite-type tricarboxylate transporter receptor subunit TctC
MVWATASAVSLGMLASAAVPTAGTQVAALLFQKETGTRFVLVPYRGGGPIRPKLRGGGRSLRQQGSQLSECALQVAATSEVGEPPLRLSVSLNTTRPAKRA